LLALLAQWCGLDAGDSVSAAAALVQPFELARLSREAVVFGETDDRWLLET
jgi:hypothetical protein